MWNKMYLMICTLGISFIDNSRSQHINGELTNFSVSRSANFSTDLNSRHDRLLNQIIEKLNTMQTLDEQQLKRLENMEYKLTRIESAEREQHTTMREYMRDFTRRMEQLDMLTNKVDSALDEIKEDMASLKQLCESQGSVVNQNRIGSTYIANIPDDFPQKLHNLGSVQQSTRASVQRLERDIHNNGRNLSLIFANLREINLQLKSLPTKQYLSSAVAGVKRHLPTYAMIGNAGENAEFGNSTVPPTCKEVPARKSGVYKISANYLLKTPFYAFCEMVLHEGGWTVIQTRLDGTVNFFKGWAEYKHGFGNIGGEYWIGLDKLHALTSSRLHELLITLEDFSGQQLFAHYEFFAIGGEKENYALNVLGSYDGTAGDSLAYSAGHKFSTFDMDNDAWNEGNCAQAHTGGWWYNACDSSNLNGRYFDGPVMDEFKYQGVYWDNFHGPNYSMKTVKMMVRAVD